MEKILKFVLLVVLALSMTAVVFADTPNQDDCGEWIAYYRMRAQDCEEWLARYRMRAQNCEVWLSQRIADFDYRMNLAMGDEQIAQHNQNMMAANGNLQPVVMLTWEPMCVQQIAEEIAAHEQAVARRAFICEREIRHIQRMRESMESGYNVYVARAPIAVNAFDVEAGIVDVEELIAAGFNVYIAPIVAHDSMTVDGLSNAITPFQFHSLRFLSIEARRFNNGVDWILTNISHAHNQVGDFADLVGFAPPPHSTIMRTLDQRSIWVGLNARGQQGDRWVVELFGSSWDNSMLHARAITDNHTEANRFVVWR